MLMGVMSRLNFVESMALTRSACISSRLGRPTLSLFRQCRGGGLSSSRCLLLENMWYKLAPDRINLVDYCYLCYRPVGLVQISIVFRPCFCDIVFLLPGVPIVIIRRSIGHCERSPDLLDVTVGAILQRSVTIYLVILLQCRSVHSLSF